MPLPFDRKPNTLIFTFVAILLIGMLIFAYLKRGEIIDNQFTYYHNQSITYDR